MSRITKPQKKKRKTKKKRRSTAWKDLEKYVAASLSGYRINRALNYSASLPDVLASGRRILDQDVDIVVECKHSQNQPFVDLLASDLSRGTIHEIGQFVFWNFDQTIQFFRSRELSVSHSTALIDHKLPKYIFDHFDQVMGAMEANLVHIVPFELSKNRVPIVVLAKKHQSIRVAYTSLAWLQQLEQLPLIA